MSDEQRKFSEIIRFIKFGLFSISAGIIETVVFYLLDLIPALGYWAAYIPALVLSVIWNFTINRRYTFHSDADIPAVMFKTFCYYLVFTPLSAILGDYIADTLYPGNELVKNIVFFATLILNFVTEFLFQRYYIYRGKIDNREEKEKE